MSPIDDELRTALQRRATAVPPSPDPLAGIERRAGRMRRNRLAASVAGSVLAVAAVATAVPLLTGPTVPDAPPVALTPPTAPASPSPTAATTAAYALDPAAPWAYRGTPVEQLGDGTVETVTREYAVRLGVPEDAVRLTPLWGQVDEPSARTELVFVATVGGAEGAARWGLARSSEAGPEFLVDEPLPSPAIALAAALPRDEVARLVVVAAPTVGALQLGSDDAGEPVPMTALAPGVGTIPLEGPLEGDPATATYRVLDPSGAELLRASVPQVAAPDGGVTPEQPVPGDAPPPATDVVDWPLRGSVPDELAEQATTAFAEAVGVSRDRVGTRLLYGGERDGTAYVLLQGWYGSDARAFAYARELGTGSPASVLMPPTAPGPAALGALLDGVLVVVPEPRAGQVLYAPDGSSEPAPVPDQGTEAAVLVARAADATGDRLLVLDGDGDPEQPIYRGTVEELLAASAS